MNDKGFSEIAQIVDAHGTHHPLGEFLTRLVKASGLGVAEIARRSHLSRSFLYLLMSDRQSPSVESLLALLEVLGCDDVRSAREDEPGDIALSWSGGRFWVQLPRGSRAAERSRSALRTLNASMTYDDAAAAASMAMPAMSAPTAAFASYVVSDGVVREADADSDKSALLAELVSRASALDEEQLRLLIENARLMGPR